MTNQKRVGNWMISYKGNRLFPLDLRPSDIDIEEIAHSLSNICRFGGHCREFYSVAQHSVLVADQFSVQHYKPLKLCALLHDATESYCGDMVRPLKQNIPQFHRIESNIWSVIAARFDLPRSIPRPIQIEDARVLITEKRDLLTHHEHQWEFPQCAFPGLEPLPDVIVPCSPKYACDMFLRAYESVVSSTSHVAAVAP